MKKGLGIICLLLTTVFFIGCGKSSDQKNTENNTKVSDTDGLVPKSDDLYSFEISLNRKLYTLPEDYSEFEKNGWTIERGDVSKIAPNGTANIAMKNGKCQVSAILINNDVDELPANKCQVEAISLSNIDNKNETTLVLPKGIQIGSDKEDVISAYGNPTKSDESAISYQIELKQFVNIGIDKKLGQVESIYMSNPGSKKDKSSSKNDSSSTEVPDSIAQYKAPSELSDNIYSFNVKFDNVVYQLPVPIKELEKNGWLLKESSSDAIAAKNLEEDVVLRKDNQTIKVEVYNDSSKATSIENCFVTEMTAEYNSNEIPLELPKGIKIGSSKADVDSAYSDYQGKRYTSSYVQKYVYDKDIRQSINILIKEDTGTVSEIMIQYVPNN